jgi:tetratricopeptide (TPR) repeat protein
VSDEIRRMLVQAAASGNPDAMLQAGATALRTGAWTEAVTPVRTVLSRHPDDPRLWHLLGLLHRNLEDHGAAVEMFAKAAELAPDDAMIAHARACVCFEAGLPSADVFERAARLAPSDRSILLPQSAALVAEGQSDAAVARLTRELRHDPKWIEGHVALSRLRWSRGERDDFLDSFEKALAADPRDAGLWRALLESLLHDGLYDRALDAARRGRVAAGPLPVFDAAEAISQNELGQLAEAAEAFQRLAPLRDVKLIAAYLRLLLRMGRPGEAAAIAERSAPLDPSHEIWPYAALAWRLVGDPRWEWLEGDPSFIGVYDIADRLPPLDVLAERLRALHRAAQHPLGQSMRGGTQTDGHLFTRIEPEIRALRRAVVEAVEQHVAALPPPRDGHPLLVPRRSPIRFAGSWSVRLTGGGRHVEHVHPAGWLSSALYISLPGEAELGAPDAGWLTLGEASGLGLDLPPIRAVEPKPGRLVLFPSTMWHGTRPFAAGERLTVAFDVARPG